MKLNQRNYLHLLIVLIFINMTAVYSHASDLDSNLKSTNTLNASINSYFPNTPNELYLGWQQAIKKINGVTQYSIKSFPTEYGETTFLKIPSINPNSNRHIIFISGVHGIEGYVGSAVQRWIIDTQLNTLRTNWNIHMIHAVNTFGIKNFRRVDEFNRDLNRSFLPNLSQIPENPKYTNFNSFLNPNENIEASKLKFIFSKFNFYLMAIKNLLKYSISDLRSTILSGQYNFERGLFYGGNGELPTQAKYFSDYLKNEFNPKSEILVIDLHTGYGERSRLHLLAGLSSSKNSDSLRIYFKNLELDYSNDDDFYKVSGDLNSYIKSLCTQFQLLNVTTITFEYGTMDSQNTIGSIDSLRRLVFENQLYWWNQNLGQTINFNNNVAHPVHEEFMQMFSPSDIEWRNKILIQTQNALSNLIE